MTRVPLIPSDLLTRLQDNGTRPGDHVPLAKLFNPAGAATWLVSEAGPDGDRLFGLADLGFGFPELGWFSMAELQALKLPFGLGIERDRTFRTKRAISVWAEYARTTGSIAEAERLLSAATG